MPEPSLKSAARRARAEADSWWRFVRSGGGAPSWRARLPGPPESFFIAGAGAAAILDGGSKTRTSVRRAPFLPLSWGPKEGQLAGLWGVCPEARSASATMRGLPGAPSPGLGTRRM